SPGEQTAEERANQNHQLRAIESTTIKERPERADQSHLGECLAGRGEISGRMASPQSRARPLTKFWNSRSFGAGSHKDWGRGRGRDFPELAPHGARVASKHQAADRQVP